MNNFYSFLLLGILITKFSALIRCGKLCDEYAKKDKRIKVIHKKNGGLSDARNAGIEVATGKYIGFVDSDDYIHAQMYELLYESLQTNKADMAVCAFQNVMDSDCIEDRVLANISADIISTEEERLSYFFQWYVEFTVAWNKLYPIQFFSSVKYPKGKIHEDEFTTYKLLEKAKRICFIEEPLYYYVHRANSITGESFSQKRLHKLDAYEERLDKYLREKRYIWFKNILFLYRALLIDLDREISQSAHYSQNILKPYKQHYNCLIYKSILKLPISLKSKLGYLAYALAPNWYKKRKQNCV